MKLRHLFFLAVALLAFSCGEDDDPKPEGNDNSKIEGDWTIGGTYYTEYDSLGFSYMSASIGGNSSQFYKFKPQGIFEEGFLRFDGTFIVLEQGSFSLKGNKLTINIQDSTGSSGTIDTKLKTGTYFVDTLTSTKLSFLDTLYNVSGHPKSVYAIKKFRAYR